MQISLRGRLNKKGPGPGPWARPHGPGLIFGPIFISGPIFGHIFMGPISGPFFMGPIPGPIYPVWAGPIYPVWAGPIYPVGEGSPPSHAEDLVHRTLA